MAELGQKWCDRVSLPDVLCRCADQWRRQGVSLGAPLDVSEVHRVWSRFGQRASIDVVYLYTTIGGFAEYDFDEDFFWTLWPWDWLQKRNDETPGAGVMFCDHSIEIVTWELRYEDEAHSSVWRSQDSELIAPSLESFLAQYLEDPLQLL